MKTNFDRTSNLITAVGVIFCLADGTIQSCNDSAKKIIGYGVESIGASLFELPWQTIDPDASSPTESYSFRQGNNIASKTKENYPVSTPIAELYAAINTGQSRSNLVLGFHKQNGELVWLSIDTVPLTKANSSELYGAEVSFIEIDRDIEPKIASKDANKQRSPQIPTKEQLIEFIPGVIYVYDAIANRHVYINPQAYDSLGYTTQEILELGHSFITQVMHPDDFARFPAHMSRLHSSQAEICKFEYRMRHKNSMWRWFCSQDRVYSRTPDGSVQQIVGIARDITNRKQTEIALRESETRLKLATDASGIGMWFWDLIDNTLEWTDRCKTIFGLSLNTELSYEKFIETLYPEDRDRTNNAVEQALANKTEYSIEYRAVWADGSVRWILAKGRGFYDRDGAAVRMMGTVQDITAQKESEQQLIENEQLLRFALSSAKAGTWNWNIVEQEVVWSPENYELYGIDPNIKPLHYQDWEHTLHPDDIESSNLEVERVLAGEATEFKTEFRIIHPKRGICWILGIGDVTCNENGEPIRLSGINLDISHLKATELALEQREHQLELLTEVIPQQIWTALPNGETDYFNQRWQQYTGLNLEQGIGRGWKNTIHRHDLPQVSKNWTEAVESGANYNMEVRLRRADGKYQWFLVKARPLRNELGEIIKWYGTNTSITRIKELEQKLLQQTEDLTNANRLKDEFLAIVSHELRTPLNPILGWSQMLTAGKLDTEKTAMGIEIIERNARLQAQLVEDLLDVSRILQGNLNLDRQPINLESIIRSALTTVNLSAEAKSLQIETIYEPNIGRVLGDAGRLQQIVWNLVANAIKFTPKNGQITIKLERVGSQAQIQVKDTGQGIDAEFLPHVFDRFRQAQSSSTREYGGLGLGLAIVRHLTELHGGTVGASSLGKGQGATFTIRLPLMNIPSPETMELDISSSEQPVQPNRFSGVKILVVDDEPDSLDILTLLLEQEGAEVISATSAQMALEAFERAIPNLIVSDIGMPETDGYTLITQIRALPQGKNIPAIALTAYAGEIDMQRTFDAGYQKHIPKPVDIPRLIDTIEQLI